MKADMGSAEDVVWAPRKKASEKDACCGNTLWQSAAKDKTGQGF